MEKFEFLYKFKKMLSEMRLSGSADKSEEISSATFYRPGKYYEVKAERYNRAGWRDQEKMSPTYRYHVKVYDKEGNHRTDEIWGRKEAIKKLRCIPGTQRAKKFQLAKDKLTQFENMKLSKVKAVIQDGQ